MRIYYDTGTGNIVKAYYDKESYKTVRGFPASVASLQIDEVIANRDTCYYVRLHVGLVDENGLERFHIDVDGDLYDRADDGWVEAPPEEF